MRKLFQVCLAVCLLLAGQVFGQEHRVSGQVISGENRDALVGVNISVKDTDRGTITDIDGRYQLEVASPQDVLIFSYIGHRTVEIFIDGRTEIDVVMTPQAVVGEDVVVIGYGTQKRKDVTSSIASLSETAFTRSSNSDPQALLQGRVAGVQITSSNGDIGGAPVIRIRGGTSVSAGNEPLIVIDGVPIDNGSAMPEIDQDIISGTRDNALSMINPSDIASIDVMKDASAAAIYGARGGNGVILITTKQGGTAGGGPSVVYEGYVSSSTQSKKLDLLSASEYKDFMASDKVQAVVTRDGLTLVPGTANTDWQDAISRTAKTQGHNVSFSSGAANTSYRVSLNYLDEQGIILNSERQRVSSRLNLTHKAMDGKLQLVLRLNPSFIKRNMTPYQQTGGFEGGLLTNVYKMNPTQPVKDSEGVFSDFGTSTRNPVALVESIIGKMEKLRLFSNATVEYDFLPALTGKINLGLDRTSASRNNYEPRSLPHASTVGGRAWVLNTNRQSVLFETTFHYSPDIGSSNSLEAWAGYTFQEFEKFGIGAVNQNFVSDVTGYENIGGGADFDVNAPLSFREQNRLISYLGRVNFNLAGKYLFSAALRREGSSRFGADQKWGMFPSLSAGLRLSDDLKIRTSFGITGNQDIGNYRSLITLGPGFNYVIGDQVLTGIAQNQLANPDLKWEQTSQINLGIDFGFMDNKFSGSVDIYSKTTTDLLLEFAVPQPAVVSTRLDNVGEVSNKGIEISLNTVNISTDDLFWRTSFNFAKNNNEVIDLGGHKAIFTGRVSGAGLSGIKAQAVMPGHSMGTFVGPKFLGYDANGDEILSTHAGSGMETEGPFGDGRFIIGNAMPNYTFGLSSNTTYKNWDVRVFVQAVQGIDILNNTRMEYQRSSNIFNGINLFAGALDDVKDGMDVEGTHDYSDKFIEDGSFIRLQNVTLGYTFDNSLFQNMRVYLSADNLFIITDYTGYDPEANTFAEEGGVATIGMDYTNIPKSRTITLGLSIGLK